MKQMQNLALGVVVVALGAACAGNDQYVEDLRNALDASDVSLKDTVLVAEGDTAGGAAVRARLDVSSDPVFRVDAIEVQNLQRFDISTQGEVISKAIAGSSSGYCTNSISLAEALDIAENEVGGEAVASVPDDDEPCWFEIQVLTSDTLMEVKVSDGGVVVEVEESDEDGSGDDD